MNEVGWDSPNRFAKKRRQSILRQSYGVRPGSFVKDRSWQVAVISALCVTVLVMAACEQKQSASRGGQPAKEAHPEVSIVETYEGVIAAVGDSLTAGYGVSENEAYPARLERQLLSDGYRYRVVNAGISGETTSGTLSRINWVLKLKPDIVILETGANDRFRGIRTDLIESNLNETIRILKEHDVMVVLAGMQIVGNLGQDYASAFKDVYPRVAEKQGIMLVPFFLESVAGNPALNQPDSIHPTAEGYEIIAKIVYPYVVEAIKRRGKNRKAAGQ